MNENGQESSLSDFEAARSSLRQRWELASVLNFFKVFEPIIESKLNISAEEIETALIQPNKSLAQLHIALLKGIPPVTKNLKDPDAWVVLLFRKLNMFWRWVAEGECPLTAAKGAEMATYRELDPTIRLVALKALCEIRADRHDVVSYINEGVKLKKEMTTFRKNNIGEDGKGSLYWCDGNETIGFRLYKELITFKKNGKETNIGCQWETLATNLEEFQKVVDEYSSSKSKHEVAVSVAVETDVIPVLNKLQKKKQKALQKKMQEEKIMNNFCRVGATRSCRNSKPIRYTFDEYDKAINEAIRETKKIKKPKEEKKSQKKATVVKEELKQDDNESTESDSENNNKLETKDVSEDSSEDSGKEPHENNDDSEETDDDDDDDDEEKENKGNHSSEEDDDNDETDDDDDEENNGSRSSKDDDNEVVDDTDDNEDNNGNDSSEDEFVKKSETENGSFVGKKRGRKEVNGNDDDDDDVQEMRNFGTKKRLRQRPNRNSAIESAVVPDSEDEISSENSDS